MSWEQFFNTVVKLARKHGPTILAAGKLAIDWFKALKPKIADWWNGKKIAIIGPVAVGKNSFYNRLQGIPIPQEHINTKSLENQPRFIIKRILEDTVFKITVKRSQNVGGEAEQRDRFWMDACKNSDVIFYLLTLANLKEGEYKAGGRIHHDLEWLAKHLGHMGTRPKIHFLVNKIDLELKQITDYDEFVEQLKPVIVEFEETVHRVLGGYKKRITGISAISMLDEGIFNRSFVTVLESVYDAVHCK